MNVMHERWFMFAMALLALTMMLLIAAPSHAQQPSPAPGDTPVNPDKSAVSEEALLQQVPRITGRIDIPDEKSSVLIQPAGRRWDRFHEVTLHWFGSIVILGMIVVLALGYLVLGRVRIAGGRSGKKVPRFSAFERFSHWLTAVSFVLLALTGLTITFGKLVLLPIMSPESFSATAQITKYVHNFVSFAFVIGLFLLVVMWIKDNRPIRADIDWVKQGGGFIKSKHASAGRFNAGEKLIFWLALFAGIAIIASGYLLLFPFYVTDIAGMQIAQVIHSLVAVLFIALILAHIYTGTLAIEGAFEAMGTGEVDLNWAKEHHDLWLAQLSAERTVDAPEARAKPSN